MTKVEQRFADESEMNAFGRQLASVLAGGAIVYLNGQLGAGKTTMTRAILRGLGFEGKVKSPTYALVEGYELSSGLDVYHFDFYRIADVDELIHLGVEDCFRASALCLIEWPEKAADFLPKPDLICDIVIDGVERQLSLSAGTAKGEVILAELENV